LCYFYDIYAFGKDGGTYSAVTILALFIRDAPDIRPDNPAFFDIRDPAGYQIALPDIQ
jgi:hypothetical protein